MSKFGIALTKGELGENIIQKKLETKGYIVYRHNTNGKHWFDMIAEKNKENIIIIRAFDIKTKARLNAWSGQGIDIRSYKEYIKFIEKTNINFYLVFVDDKCGDVYCLNLITAMKLEKSEQSFNPTFYIIAWYLKDMKFWFNIGQEAIDELSKFDQRNYDYDPEFTKIEDKNLF